MSPSVVGSRWPSACSGHSRLVNLGPDPPGLITVSLQEVPERGVRHSELRRRLLQRSALKDGGNLPSSINPRIVWDQIDLFHIVLCGAPYAASCGLSLKGDIFLYVLSIAKRRRPAAMPEGACLTPSSSREGNIGVSMGGASCSVSSVSAKARKRQPRECARNVLWDCARPTVLRRSDTDLVACGIPALTDPWAHASTEANGVFDRLTLCVARVSNHRAVTRWSSWRTEIFLLPVRTNSPFGQQACPIPRRRAPELRGNIRPHERCER